MTKKNCHVWLTKTSIITAARVNFIPFSNDDSKIQRLKSEIKNCIIYIIFGTTILFSHTAVARDEQSVSPEIKVIDESSRVAQLLNQTNQSTEQNHTLTQVTSVAQLSDVQPTDWAFQALQSLVERYGCIAGYPDGNYRGNQALTRYEFAASLNACLNRTNELISTATSSLIQRDDLATIQRLQQEFVTELAMLRGRVDSLEVVTTELATNQFSTTTQLTAEVIFGIAGIFTGENAAGDNLDDSTVFVDRLRLELNTSFTGRDLLYTLLSTGNFTGFSTVTDTPEGELSFAQDNENDLILETLEYIFPIGESTEVLLAFTGAAFYDFTSTLNILDGDGGSGALSAFGTRNPIYNLGDGAGLGIRQQLANNLELSLGYLAAEASTPGNGGGLFNGAYGTLAQLVFKPSDRLNIGLTYINSYNLDNTFTGSSRASLAQFDDTFFEELDIPGVDVLTSSNSYGVELSWQVSDYFVLGGWVGYTNTRLLTTANGLFERGDLNIWNYAVTLAFPDLGREGNLLGFVVGMEPKVTTSTINSTNPNIEVDVDADMSLHIEGFYQLQLTENLTVTPGIIWITAPDFNRDNDGSVIGAIRTTFTF